MLGWLYRIFIGRFGCQHKWNTIKIIECYSTWDGEHYEGQNPEFHKYVQKCNQCGKIKVKKV